MQRKRQTVFLFAMVMVSLVAVSGCDKLRARDKLNKGVQAYKGGQTDAAIEDFKQATQFDPDLLNAGLYLATAYSAKYIPGAPSPENIRNGDRASVGHRVPGEIWGHGRRRGGEFEKSDDAASRLRRRHGLPEPALSPEGGHGDPARSSRGGHQIRGRSGRSGQGHQATQDVGTGGADFLVVV